MSPRLINRWPSNSWSGGFSGRLEESIIDDCAARSRSLSRWAASSPTCVFCVSVMLLPIRNLLGFRGLTGVNAPFGGIASRSEIPYNSYVHIGWAGAINGPAHFVRHDGYFQFYRIPYRSEVKDGQLNTHYASAGGESVCTTSNSSAYPRCVVVIYHLERLTKPILVGTRRTSPIRPIRPIRAKWTRATRPYEDGLDESGVVRGS